MKDHAMEQTMRNQARELIQRHFGRGMELIMRDTRDIIKCCGSCGYWGGCDSVGDIRKCYNVDIYSNMELEMKARGESCESGWVKKGK